MLPVQRPALAETGHLLELPHRADRSEGVCGSIISRAVLLGIRLKGTGPPMSDKKTIKRSIRAVWDKVKQLRSERSKLYAPDDINASAEALAASASELRGLAKQLSSLSAMPPVGPQTPPATHKPKKKARPTEDAD